ncbi:MAG: hypothetical protein LCI02_12025 [Proteobacteria bacterium]|nr:hypothetical protein [Pseudomonadota bacterium]
MNALKQASVTPLPANAAPNPAPATVPLWQGEVVVAVDGDDYEVALSAAAPADRVKARPGALLPQLVAGDVVLLARPPADGPWVIVSVLQAAAAAPWHERAIALRSSQSIALQCGASTFKLTAQGLARLVALTIEHDARDLVDIDGAEVRIN